MNNATLRVYFELLVTALRTAENELEVMETYITEESIEDYFNDYAAMNNHISILQREIKRVGKKLGMDRDLVRSYIN